MKEKNTSKKEKKKRKKQKKERNFYDRVFRENAKHLFMPLIQQMLGITIHSYTPLPEKITKTIEREMDFLETV